MCLESMVHCIHLIQDFVDNKEVNDFGGQVLIEEVYNTIGIKKGAQGKSRGQLDRNKNR